MTGKRYYQEELRAKGRKRVYWILSLDIVERIEDEATRRRTSPRNLVGMILQDWLDQNETPTSDKAGGA